MAHADDRSKMIDEINAPLRKRPELIRLPDVDLGIFEAALVQCIAQIHCLCGIDKIESDNVIATREKMIDEIATNKPVCTGNKNRFRHRGNFLSLGFKILVRFGQRRHIVGHVSSSRLPLSARRAFDRRKPRHHGRDAYREGRHRGSRMRYAL